MPVPFHAPPFHVDKINSVQVHVHQHAVKIEKFTHFEKVLS